GCLVQRTSPSASVPTEAHQLASYTAAGQPEIAVSHDSRSDMSTDELRVRRRQPTCADRRVRVHEGLVVPLRLQRFAAAFERSIGNAAGCLSSGSRVKGPAAAAIYGRAWN